MAHTSLWAVLLISLLFVLVPTLFVTGVAIVRSGDDDDDDSTTTTTTTSITSDDDDDTTTTTTFSETSETSVTSVTSDDDDDSTSSTWTSVTSSSDDDDDDSTSSLSSVIYPPGACCCSGCEENRCIENVTSQHDCSELCGNECSMHWSFGQSCGESSCEQPIDCCPDDPFVIEGSLFASSALTMCGTHDYNCDGVDDQLPCCYGDETAPNDVDSRIVYLASSCNASLGQPLSQEPTEVCGACSGDNVVVPGWECTSGLVRRKRTLVQHCPEICDDPVVTVSPYTPPTVGECASFVDSCIGDAGGDGERCCVVVTQ